MRKSVVAIRRQPHWDKSQNFWRGHRLVGGGGGKKPQLCASFRAARSSHKQRTDITRSRAGVLGGIAGGFLGKTARHGSMKSARRRVGEVRPDPVESPRELEALGVPARTPGHQAWLLRT